MEEYVKEFLIESYENLDQIERDLLVLEKKPTDQDTLASIFRMFHTIKGSCGIVGFEEIETITHAGETLLGRVRDDIINITSEIITTLFKVLDSIRSIFSNIEKNRLRGFTG
ncbi:Hpt domain-containing protein [Desulfococcaceae bacterium HSG9]|nr:Hpt domain-containing protein [Desulfococcaceae bacterium HSG9]